MKTAEERIAELEARVSKLESGTQKVASGEGAVASAADLDGKFGNEPIRKDPTAKYWTGDTHVGDRMSDCPPEYLDALAKYKDACAFMNEKNADPSKAKYIEYDRRDAARARGWAQRIRSGGSATTSAKSNPDAARYGTSAVGNSAKHRTDVDDSSAFDTGSEADDMGGDLPFATCAHVPARHVRMPRWERW